LISRYICLCEAVTVINANNPKRYNSRKTLTDPGNFASASNVDYFRAQQHCMIQFSKQIFRQLTSCPILN